MYNYNYACVIMCMCVMFCLVVSFVWEMFCHLDFLLFLCLKKIRIPFLQFVKSILANFPLLYALLYTSDLYVCIIISVWLTYRYRG